ncbi:hypothetical protein [Mucilaginibacter sp.]|uniref:hypothetical protein n=1 Tax=Mucilaginibacter sp. TaxID=1882438 RepID=UPI0035BC75E5
MKTITVPGDPATIRAIMVAKADQQFHDHETIRLDSSDSDASVEKTIFRIVDGGEDKWELQFE